ncbi:hypothetical protein JOB18_038363 [Solea senegalensis]|uniref:Uncharacterized protein n=1 Tax=Solea senegalensis TaxID=28829 RepID=A0AAV6T9Z7_SOLSE|nr:hypothetical protein JOB18_038363 [Solea senegalensis]
MDVQPQTWPYLEPIQEEPEQEDESSGSDAGEGGDEDFQVQVGMETEDEDEDEDDDAPLRVLRSTRLSESFLQIQSTGQMEEPHVSDLSTSEEATTSEQPSGSERQSRSPQRRKKMPKIRKQKCVSLKRKKKKRRSSRGSSLVKPFFTEELFPPWLVELMVNIEEATTHQLVIE